MRTEVYCWRVSRKMKSALQREARRRKLSLSEVPDLAVGEWLKNSASGTDAEEEQERIRRSAGESFGCLAGAGNPGPQTCEKRYASACESTTAANARRYWRFSIETIYRTAFAWKHLSNFGCPS